ncbi:hypothetical protein PR048_020978 [Dryococelus australis]|uniref:DDE Tnp4 domain-containing protein n=1 Tax=Dryococelus australis TaxID=614101 RepID=A0ABQ9GWZ6_9NEOP|nr:hypothetical protein PR048_020978 [Dryococelus australis]
MRYVLVANDAFPLREYIMKPFSRKVATPANKIFSYRLSRARRMIEIHHIVMACCTLHNFLRSKVHQKTPLESLDEEELKSGNVSPGPRCNESMSLSKTSWHPTNSAKLVRESFVENLNNGHVPWQQRFNE